MSAERKGRSGWTKWLLAFGCWTLLALVFASQSYVYSAATGEDKGWKRVLAWTLVDWYIWAALSPFILWLARRFRFERGNWGTALLVHLGAGIGFSLLHLALQTCAQHFAAGQMPSHGTLWESVVYLFTKKIHLDLLTYAGIVGISHAASYYRRYHEREAETHKLEAQLARAQMQTLQMQLRPHFLFNTLNTLSELLHRDQRAADRMIARLGDLLRLTLESGTSQEVSLRQELDFLRKYLEIEQTRFHDRLTVDFKIDPISLDARLPNMILQPIVENAIKHGIATKPGAGRIEISAGREDGMLRVRVSDDGAGLPPDWKTAGIKEGIGLSNTRQRLEQLYDGKHKLEFSDARNGGAEVSLAVPFRAN